MAALRAIVALTSVAVLAATATPAAAAPYDEGLSQPREDSYYPTKGNPGVDVLHYGLDLDWRRTARTLRGTATLDVRVTEATYRVRLDLLDDLEVGSVTVDGAPVTATHPGKNLVVPLGSEVPADTRLTLVIEYAGRPHPVPAPSTRSDMPTVGMNVTRDGQLWTMQEPFGAFTWYPVNDHPSDKALYDIQIESPAGWSGIANGIATKLPPNGNRPVTAWHLRDPAASYLITLAVGPYAHRQATGPHGLPLHFYVPQKNVRKWMKPFRRMDDDLRWLERKLGRYPFETAGALVVPGDSAMETQSLVTFGAQDYEWRNVRETMAHELAHQWYGDTVTPDDWTGLWMNEGMAMYLQGRWSAEVGGVPWRLWTKYYADGNRRLRPLDGPPAAYKRGRFGENCVYLCTAAMFEQLRTRVGNREFNSLVRRWPQTHRNQNANRKAYVAWVEQETGRELTRFFRHWLLAKRWR
jgi:aminopeptidase N